MSHQRHTSLLLTLLVLLPPTLGATDTDQAVYYRIDAWYMVSQSGNMTRYNPYSLWIHKDTTLGTLDDFVEKEKIDRTRLNVVKNNHTFPGKLPDKDTLSAQDQQKTFGSFFTSSPQANSPAPDMLLTTKDVLPNAFDTLPYNSKRAILDKDTQNNDVTRTFQAFVQAHQNTLQDFIDNLDDDAKKNLKALTHDGPKKGSLVIDLCIISIILGAKVLFFPSEDDAENPTSPHAKTKKTHNPHPYNDDKDPTPPTHKDNA